MHSKVIVVLFISFLFCNLESSAQTISDLQKGESVVQEAEASPFAPKTRDDGDPWVEISNMSVFSHLGKPNITFDFKVTEGSIDVLQVAVKTTKDYFVSEVIIDKAKQGNVVVTAENFSIQLPNDFELWIEHKASTHPGGRKPGFKISKSVTHGSITKITFAKDWRSKPSLPNNPSPTPEKVEVAQLPVGFVPLPLDIEFHPGTPIKAFQHGRWETVTIYKSTPNSTATQIFWDDSKLIQRLENKVLAIEPQVVTRQKDADAKTFFADRLNNLQGQKKLVKVDHGMPRQVPNAQIPPGNNIPPNTQIPPQTNKHLKYPVRIPLQSGTSLVPAKLAIKKGTKLYAVWGNRWLPLTVLEDSASGPVKCGWDGYGNSWDEAIDRESLAISDSNIIP